jgi:hypothetical protein
MNATQATGEVFFTAFKSLSRQEQEVVLSSIAQDRRLRRLMEDLSDRLVIADERAKPARPLRDYIQEREARDRTKTKRAR